MENFATYVEGGLVYGIQGMSMRWEQRACSSWRVGFSRVLNELVVHGWKESDGR